MSVDRLNFSRVLSHFSLHLEAGLSWYPISLTLLFSWLKAILGHKHQGFLELCFEHSSLWVKTTVLNILLQKFPWIQLSFNSQLYRWAIYWFWLLQPLLQCKIVPTIVFYNFQNLILSLVASYLKGSFWTSLQDVFR